MVTFDFPPGYGGLQRYCARLTESLAGLGYPVAVVAPDHPSAPAYDRAFPAPVRRFGGRSRPLRLLTAWVQALRARSHVRDNVTIAASWFPAGLTAVLLPRSARGRLTILAHGLELGAIPHSMRERLLRSVFLKADRIVAISGFTARRLRAAGVNGSIAIVPCGVDVLEIPRAPAPVPTILFIGRLVPRKGCDRLIASLDAVRRHLGNVRLEIVGDGPDRTRLIALATQLGVAEFVEFRGAVTDEERNAAFSRAWCFAMPVRNENADVEGFGIVYLEAAMAALPAIGGKGSGAEDAIVDGVTGMLVDGNDQSDVSKALIDLLENPQKAHAMGAAGRQRALSEFTWRHVASSLAREIGLAPP